MTPAPLDRVRSIRDIPALIAFLRDELDWPIEADDFDKFTFDYEPEELGIDASTATQIEEIKQLRPLVSNQPWGVFFIRFEPKRLPVVVLRRILSQLVVRKRASASKSDLATWNLHDLLFISNYGEDDHRQITFAHFTQDTASGDLPTLKVLGWDDADAALHISHVHHELKAKLHWPEDEKDLDSWREQWSSAFTLRHRQVITTSKDLAIRLADLARRIRKRAGQVLAVETERGPLRKLHKAFRAALIHDLSEDDFADMYAQTIAYGLLAARVSRPMGIIAENVTDMVPVTNPFLREMLGTFLTIGGRKGKMDFDELGIQDVVDLLNSPDTHMEAILRDFGNRTRQEDPVIHFYELFLAEYDKKMKVKRGVFYTPQPVVSYIVRSVHELLQTEFGLQDGLADTTTWGEMAKRNPAIKIPEGVSEEEPFVQILDVATGTATFLVEVIDVIHKSMTAKWIREKRLELEFDRLWNEYVPKHLLSRLYGYELMMAPYAIAHMKIGLKLFETGYRFGSGERAHIYLTNALEPPSILAEQAAANLFEALGHEAQAVNAVKRNKRFTVVIGNPPYSNFGQLNKIPFILDLLNDYKRGLNEKKLNLDDDFIKFIRFAQWHIDKTGHGIVGFITSNTDLDGITHRRMRESLKQAFDGIYILDLHGSSKKKEKTPDGGKDENVFDITVGVSILLAVRLAEAETLSGRRVPARVFHVELWGERKGKYDWLWQNDASQTTWTELAPTEPHFFFTPKDFGLDSEYMAFPVITDCLSAHNTGIQTKRDSFVYHFTEEDLQQVIQDLNDLSPATTRQRYSLPPDGRDWTLQWAKEDVKRNHGLRTRVLYHPFDHRWTLYTGKTKGFMAYPRAPLMRSTLHDNHTLLCVRNARRGNIDSFLVANTIVDKDAVSPFDNVTFFPLYLYPAADELDVSAGRRPNINPELLKALAEKLKISQAGPHGFPQGVTPEDIFRYAYAVFHSPTYRTRYAEFLKIDFPRLPLTSSLELFHELARLGGELVALHLVEAPVQTGISIRHDETDGWIFTYATPPPVRIAFTGPAEPVVDKVGWSDDVVWIDAVKPQKGATDVKVTGTVGFRGVPEEVWNFHIGGYQVCQKWLKDRKGRKLGTDDLVHYHRIVVALHETIRLMAEIDRVIAAHGGWPIK